MRPALVLALLLLAGSVAAAPPKPREVSILVYHVPPDPLAGPERAGLTDAGRLPVTRFDGVALASDAPEGDPTSAGAHFQEMRRLLLERESGGTPVALRLAASVEGHALRVEANASDPGARLRATVFEDLPGRRFAARESREIDGPVGFENASWDPARLGVVVSAENATTGEVLQSAAWLPGDGQVVQEEKAVLVEHATASWCEPCAPSDSALDLLASQYGFPAPAGSHAFGIHATALGLAGLAGGAALGILLAWRRPW